MSQATIENQVENQTVENKRTMENEDVKFEQALNMITTGGKALKQGMQLALREATLAVLTRKDLSKIDRLDAKLQLLESDYYLKLIRSNFAAYCGIVDVELDQKGVTRYYRKKEPCLYYSKEKGDVGWKLSCKRLQEYKKTYDRYFSNVHFVAVKIENRDSSKTADEKWIDYAKNLYAQAKKYRDGRELWENINSPWIKVIEYLSKMPNIE